MTQGRKSKTVLALVGALASVALAIPALAAAQAADDEYNLTLPGAGGSDNGSSTQSATGAATGAKASSASTAGAPTPTGGDDAVAAPASGSGGDGSGANDERSKAKDEGATAGGSQKGSNVASNSASPAPSAGSAEDGGGLPILLIALAVIAAACVGAAAWRLRNRPDGGAGKLGTGTPPAPGKSQ